jgi:hypothetical protein
MDLEIFLLVLMVVYIKFDYVVETNISVENFVCIDSSTIIKRIHSFVRKFFVVN